MKENYVTGASGFVGSHLIGKLDRFIPIPHEKITSFDYLPYDKFFFLSAYGNMADQTDDNKILQANISDLVHAIRNTEFKDIESFVYMSTSSVKLKYQTMYSRTKKAGEEILLSFAEKYNAPISILRPYSITGVGEQKQHLIPKLIESCFTGKGVRLVLEPKHDFIDIDDVVNGIMNLSNNQAKGVFELGTGISYSNLEVLNMIQRITKKTANISTIGNLRPYDTEDWVCRNFHARQFGWSPKKSLEQSITEMVESYE